MAEEGPPAAEIPEVQERPPQEQPRQPDRHEQPDWPERPECSVYEREPGLEPDRSPPLTPPFLRRKADRLVQRWAPAGHGRWAPQTGRRWMSIAVAVTGIVVAACTTVLLLSGGPAREATPPLPLADPAGSGSASPPSSTTAVPESLVVSVVGKVAKPGLVTLPAGARVADALAAAGGAVGEAARTTVNLARQVTDGEQLYVGIPRPAGMPSAPTGAGRPGTQPKHKVDLNTANQKQLEELPGVGEVTAQRIIEWRTEHGGFSTVDQLRDVDGIGRKRFDDLRELVQVR